MSFEKIAQDAYTQGLTETLRNMEVSDQIKIAAYKQAALLGALTGAIGEDGALAGMGNEIADTAVGGLAGAGLGAAAGGATFGALGPDRINKMLAAEAARTGRTPLTVGKARGKAALLGALGAGIIGSGAGMSSGAANAYLQNLGIID